MPEAVDGRLAALNKRPIQRLLVITRVRVGWVRAFAFCDPDFEVSELGRLAYKDDVAFCARAGAFCFSDFEAADAVERVIPHDRLFFPRPGIESWCPLDPDAPAATVLAARELYELGC